MTSPQDPPDAAKTRTGAASPATAKAPTKDRLAAALRENLRRRKAQRMGRAQRTATQPAGPDEG